MNDHDDTLNATFQTFSHLAEIAEGVVGECGRSFICYVRQQLTMACKDRGFVENFAGVVLLDLPESDHAREPLRVTFSPTDCIFF